MEDQILDYSTSPSEVIDERFVKKLRIFTILTIIYIILIIVDYLIGTFSVISDESIRQVIYYVQVALYIIAVYSLAEILKKYEENTTLIILIYLLCFFDIGKSIFLAIYPEKTALYSVGIGLPSILVKLIMVFKVFFVSHKDIYKYFRWIGLAIIVTYIGRLLGPLMQVILRLELPMESINYIVLFIVPVSILILQLKVHNLLNFKDETRSSI